MEFRMDRKVIFLVAALLVIPAISMVLPGSSGYDEEAKTRADSGFISKDDFYLHTEYNRDNLWIVVWMENRDTIYTKYPGSDNYYHLREVANSFAFPVNGGTYTSGTERRVLAELFTATDCAFCPGAEGALDTLVNERFPEDFSLIEWHRALNPGNDPYETGSSQGRFGSYNISGTPMVIFDGVRGIIGGDTNPSNAELLKAYGDSIDHRIKEEPLVTFSGQADHGGNYLWFNVTFDVINPMPKGNWSIKAAVCEDLQKDHSGATMRHTPRGTVETKQLTDLQEGYPDINVDIARIFNEEDREHFRDDMNIYWSASDEQDGSSLDIDIIYRERDGQWKELASDLENTGSYTWDTLDPRIPDGNYHLRIMATDSDMNTIISRGYVDFVIDNLDLPVGNFTYPVAGDSLKGRETIRWTSDDDEDGPENLLCRVSIRNSTEADWRIISFNQVNGEDWIVNLGRYDLNTLNYDDLSTYELKIDLLDSDEMMTTIISDRFEIYNNDAPRSYLIGPEENEVISGVLDIGWKVTDEEDPPSAIYGNFSIKKDGQTSWTVIWEGLLDDEMENKTFNTADLFGDGDYTLMLSITDSRGSTHSTSTSFSVFDPDAPAFSSIEGPGSLSDIRSDTIGISWECSDKDQGEEISYDVWISPSDEDNWTMVGQDLTETSFDVPLSGLEEGSYRLRVEAEDPTGLKAEVAFGPFFYNAPDAPEIFSVSHVDGLSGQLPEDVNETLEEGSYVLELIWNSRDADGDNVTYEIYYKMEGDPDWTLLAGSLEEGIFEWNLTSLISGQYQIRIVATDSSDKELSSEIVQGPFTWFNVFTDNEDEEPEPNEEGHGGDETDSALNIGVIILVAVGSVMLIIIVVIISLILVSRLSKSSKKTDVIPSQDSMDYNAIPEFERTAPSVPVSQPQMVQTGPVQTTPVQMSADEVNWEDENAVPSGAGTEDQAAKGSEQVQQPPDVLTEEDTARQEPPVPETVDEPVKNQDQDAVEEGEEGIGAPPPPPI